MAKRGTGRKSFTSEDSRIQELEERLLEAQETIEAIRAGAVDAIIVSGEKGEQVFTLQGPDTPYRAIIETMGEGAVSLDDRGTIIYSNKRFSEILKAPMESVIGSSFYSHIRKDHRQQLRNILLSDKRMGTEICLMAKDGSPVPVYISGNGHPFSKGGEALCLMVTDISELARTRDVLQKSRDELEIRVKERTAELEQANAALKAEVQERRRAEEQLTASRDQIQSIIDNTPALVYVFDLKERFILANKALARLFDRKPKDLIGKRRHEFMPKDIADRHEANDRQAIEQGQAIEFEEYGPMREDGRLITWLTTKFPLHDSQGDIYGVAGISTDISERKEASDELERRVRERTETLQRQAGLLELAHNAIVVSDTENRITFWNRGAEEMYGFSREEVLGQAPYTLLRTVFPIPLEQLTDELYRKEHWEGELIHTTKDGRCLTVLSRRALQRDAEGTPVSIMEINLDITARKQAENAIQLAYAYNRSLIEASLDPLVTITAEGTIGDVNAATEAITGCNREELVGKDFCDYFTEPDKAREGYRKAFDTGYVRDYALKIRHMDGHATDVLYNASTYKDHRGSVLGVFAVARDVTAQRHLEEQLRQAHKMEALGTLAGGIAHDFNNMLAVILGNAELALDELDEMADEAGGTRGNMEQIIKASKRSRDLVRQILAFSRKEVIQSRKPLNLSPLLQETVDLLRGPIPSTVTIHLDITATSPTILGDPSQIQEVLMNLASNSVYAMGDDGGKLTIKLSNVTFKQGELTPQGDLQPGHYVKLSVSDTGTGMSDEVKAKIFDPFFTTKGQGEGTGMGLAVAFGIIKSHGGAITVRSKQGKGSTFDLFFPVYAERSAQEARHAIRSLPTGTERILLVDDEPLILDMVERMLRSLGYAVVAAQNGSEALTVFQKEAGRVDLIITDHVMPEMTGIRLAEKVMKVKKGIPVILFTGYSDAVTPEKAKQAGIRSFVMKPVIKSELAGVVRKVLDDNKAT